MDKAVQQAQQEASRAQQSLHEKQKEASVQIHSLQDQLKKVLWDLLRGSASAMQRNPQSAYQGMQVLYMIMMSWENPNPLR